MFSLSSENDFQFLKDYLIKFDTSQKIQEEFNHNSTTSNDKISSFNPKRLHSSVDKENDWTPRKIRKFSSIKGENSPIFVDLSNTQSLSILTKNLGIIKKDYSIYSKKAMALYYVDISISILSNLVSKTKECREDLLTYEDYRQIGLVMAKIYNSSSFANPEIIKERLDRVKNKGLEKNTKQKSNREEKEAFNENLISKNPIPKKTFSIYSDDNFNSNESMDKFIIINKIIDNVHQVSSEYNDENWIQATKKILNDQYDYSELLTMLKIWEDTLSYWDWDNSCLKIETETELNDMVNSFFN